MRTFWLIMGCLGGLAAGCGGKPDFVAPGNVRLLDGVTEGESITGSRVLQATAEDDSGTVARVEFLVSGVLACGDETARRSGSTFSCTWDASSFTPGPHQLLVRAWDAAGNNASSAPLAFTVRSANSAPMLGPISLSQDTVDEGSPVRLTLTASDPEGDALRSVWTQSPFAPAGTFAEGPGATTTWTAPLLSQDTLFTLRVTVSDGRGGSTQGSVQLKVVNVAALNQPPAVEDDILVERAGLVAGKDIPLFIGARDADGDPLTYSWTTDPPGLGAFTRASQATAAWRSGELGQAASYTLRVTVSDGTVSVDRATTVTVGVPTYARDIEPLWSPKCADCHNAFGPDGLDLQVGRSLASLRDDGVGPCNAGPRIVPGRPDESLLVLRLSDAACGNRMPQDNPEYFNLNPGELTRIRSWILAGALDN